MVTEILFEQKNHPNSVFLHVGNFCLFCHEYASWYFFTKFHTGVD